MRFAIFQLSILCFVDSYVFNAGRAKEEDAFRRVWHKNNNGDDNDDAVNDAYPYWYDSK